MDEVPPRRSDWPIEVRPLHDRDAARQEREYWLSRTPRERMDAADKHSAAHAGLLSRGAKRLGAPIEEFVGFQLDVPNPPWMSMLAMSFDC
jgi:hypothetical protein